MRYRISFEIDSGWVDHDLMLELAEKAGLVLTQELLEQYSEKAKLDDESPRVEEVTP